MKAKVNEDLQKERLKCSFDINELTNFLDGNARNTEYRRRLENKVLSIPGILDTIPEEYLGHKEKYENAIRKATLLHKVQLQADGPDLSEEDKVLINCRNSISAAVFRDYTPFGVHFSMFIPTLRNQTDEKQKAYWLPRAMKLQIIGTYAQTELGHGTFIRGLETTATYDPATEEFILNSPTLTSYKWWPGHLAQTTNYCVVMAQLYTKGKNCGVQPFLVQIRDEETHMPLPGIKVGDIGPKLGFNTVNNGFLGFNNVRIPRDRLLMKYVQISKDGTFKASPNSKLAYGTMVYVRVLIVNNVACNLARAVTIAVRYAAIRRQSERKPNEPEPQILDYVTQQHKLFIAISTTYAYIIFARWLWQMYNRTTQDMASGKLNNLPELHSVACVMKVLSSSDSTALIEQCRLACGGHGYMLSSNLPQLYGISTATCTYEGENTVLLLQTARSLVKAWSQKEQGLPLPATTAYLAEKLNPEKWDHSLDGIVRSFKRVAYGKLSTSVSSMAEYQKSGMSPEDAWNKASVQLIAAAEAHGRAVLLSVLKSEIDKKFEPLSNALKTVLMQLVELYFVHWTLQKTGDLLLYTQLSGNDVRALQRRYEDLLEKIRPNAVGIVDAYDFRDEVLHSTLGAYDGQAYERLMNEAMKSPLNKEPVNESFHKYLKPFMRSNL